VFQYVGTIVSEEDADSIFRVKYTDSTFYYNILFSVIADQVKAL